MATLDASQFLIRVYFDYQLIVGRARRRLRVGGATAPPTHSHLSAGAAPAEPLALATPVKARL